MPPPITAATGESPLDFLLSVMKNPDEDARLRVRAAVAAAQYMHHKRGEGGKKDAKLIAATKAGNGKFATAEAPKLVVNNR